VTQAGERRGGGRRVLALHGQHQLVPVRGQRILKINQLMKIKHQLVLVGGQCILQINQSINEDKAPAVNG